MIKNSVVIKESVDSRVVHSVELLLDDALDGAVRTQWQALAEAVRPARPATPAVRTART